MACPFDSTSRVLNAFAVTSGRSICAPLAVPLLIAQAQQSESNWSTATAARPATSTRSINDCGIRQAAPPRGT